MKVIKIPPHGFGCNSYIVTKDNKNAIIIDCSADFVFDECIKRSLKPKAVLLTHGHFDHVSGCSKFYQNGIPVYCGEGEKELIFSEQFLSYCNGAVPHFEIQKTLKDGESLQISEINIKVISTAGHSAGGVCYQTEDCLFTGDTLFFESIGRTDLFTGDFRQLKESIKKLYALDGDCTVYCGHGRETTLSHERQFNPYIKI